MSKNHCRLSAVWLLLMAPLAIAADPPAREIYVPFEELNTLLEGPTRRVLLSRQEYDALVKKACPTPAEKAPQDVVLSSANYQMTVDDQRARIQGTLTLEVLAEGLHAVPLALEEVGIRRAELDGRSASIGHSNEPCGRFMLFVEGLGQHQLTLDLVTGLGTNASQQTLSFRLPRPAATRLRASVPGNVEVKQGADVMTRQVDEQAGVTRFELLPIDGKMTIALSLNNRQQRQQRVVIARGVLIDEVTAAYERLHATVSLAVLHQAIDRCRFAVPDGFEVLDVSAVGGLARWSVDKQGPKRTLDIILRQPTTETVVLRIAATRAPALLADWTFPQLTALDVAGQVSVLGLVVEDRLKPAGLTSEGLIPFDVAVLNTALGGAASESDQPPARMIAAYYAPDAAFKLGASFTRPPAELRVTSNLLLVVRETGLEARGGFALTPEAERRFGFDFIAPPGWQVRSVKDQNEAVLPIEHYRAADGTTRVHVRLPLAILPGDARSVYFEAESTPDGWLDDWILRQVSFPAFAVVGATKDLGAIAVGARDDLAVRPETLTDLTPLDETEKKDYGLTAAGSQLAYRYEALGYKATVTVERLAPRLTARSYSFFRVDPDLLTAHYELVYDVTRARSRRLSFLLPNTTPEAVTVRGLDGLAIKETSSEPVEGSPLRRWTAQLADGHQGRARLAVDFQQALPAPEPKGYALPVIAADDVMYQSGIVVVEGNADFDVQVVRHPRKADVGELVDADYQVGRRLLGVFGFVGKADDVAINVTRHPGYPLQAALVQTAHYVTLLAASGVSQTSAHLQLRTKAPFLEIELPAGSTLWSAELDGKPAQPQHQGQRLLLSFPAEEVETLRDLQIVYETSVERVQVLGRIKLPALRLAVHEAASGKSASAQVPVADVRWELYLPSGYRLLRSRGSVDPVAGQALSELAAWKVAGLMFEASGSFLLPTVHNARESGRIARARFDRTITMQEAQREGRALDEVRLGDGETAKPANEPASVSASAAKSERAAGARRQSVGGSKFVDGVGVDFDPPQFQNFTPATSGRMGRAGGRGGAPFASAPFTAPLVASGGMGGSMAGAAAAGAPFASPQTELEKAKKGRADVQAGVRSLRIDLQSTDEPVVFESLGVAPRIDVTLVEARRLRAVAWLLGLSVVVAGLALTPRPARIKARFLVLVCLAATLIPLTTGWFELALVFNGAFYSACLLAVYYLLAGVACSLTWKRCPSSPPTPATIAAGVLCLLAASNFSSPASAEEPVAKPPIVVQIVPPSPPIQVPDDATILLYDQAEGLSLPKAERLLVPYDRYVELWNRAYPDRKLTTEPSPADYAPAGATFSTTLTGEQFLAVTGVLDFDVFVADKPVEIPLPLQGGVLASALLDGQPARLKVVVAARPVVQQIRAQPAPGDQAVLMLSITGRGRHRLEVALRLKLERNGGWRSATAHLPAVGAATLELMVPVVHSELRLSGVPDRRSYETRQANETIATALGAEGRLHIEWRPRVDLGQIDATLQARSQVLFDVQEDGLRVAWELALEFSRAEREKFVVVVPGGYLVDKIVGDNVRGWSTPDAGQPQRLEVTLLRPASEREKFTVYLSKRSRLGVEPSTVDAPVVTVEGAALHSGELSIRRSAVLDLQTAEIQGVTRTDFDPQTEKRSATVEPGDRSPLGVVPYQSYRFSATPFGVQLKVDPLESRATAEVQTVWKVAERQRSLETRVLLKVRGRPRYELQVVIPDDLRVEQVSAPGAYEWTVAESEGRRVLTVVFAAGQSDTTAVVISGPIGKAASVVELPLPRLEVLDVTRQQGELVVQADPALNVEAADLAQCERVLLDRTASWLTEQQRKLARIALAYEQADYAGTLRISLRTPVLQGYTVTNVRVTDRSIEETILLDLTVRDAGIREVVFLLPESLRDAKISVPLLRQKTIEPLPGPAGNRQVRVRLQLQDAVMNELRVLVENDRLHTREVQEVPIPVLEGGRTEGRYVAVETSGRDEVVVEQTEGLETLVRGQQQWQVISRLLSGGNTQAYRVRPDAAAPRLTYRSRDQATVETVGARIGLAETDLVVDAHGAYRAVQTYRLYNSTEQFLEIELPAGASLWTALIAGEPVKPTQSPGATSARRVRIPLIKTAAGDLDYALVLTYGGKLPEPGTLARIEFPLMKTVNVNVELSNVRLYLPETFRWFGFGGTMREAAEEADLQAGSVSYLTKMTERLSETMRSADPFASVRAISNLGSLKSTVDAYRGSSEGYGYITNASLDAALSGNSATLRQAQQQAQAVQSAPQGGQFDDNRKNLTDVFSVQLPASAFNVVGRAGQNFYSGETTISGGALQVQPRAPASQPGQFDALWFAGNDLSMRGQPNSPMQDLGVVLTPSKTAASQPAPAPQLDAARDKKGIPLQKSQFDVAKPVYETRTRSAESDVVQRYQQRLGEESRNRSANETNQRQGGRELERTVPALQGAVPGQQAPAAVQSPLAGGLASLDVQIPRRGTVYRFTTPRGDVRITAQAASTSLVEGLFRVVVVAVVALVLAMLFRAVRSGRLLRWLNSRLSCGVVLLLAVFSLLLGLPTMVLLLTVIGLVLCVRRWTVPTG